ncbi:MAG TPA: hypothetical protein VFX54_11150 [Candidatus Binatia bacterium]|nr:hypothetical protein [Candidatus Binatia bacterium]
MSNMTENLKSKFTEVIQWERRKRREEILLLALCVALALALVLFPLHVLLPIDWLRWLVPAVLFAGLAPICFYRRRWVRQDVVRAAASLDKTLGLQERAVTAWELSARNETGSGAQLVFKQAEKKLGSIQSRTLFPRRRGLPAYLVLPLFIIWFTLLWLDVDRWNDAARSAGPQTLAQKAREFSRQLQQKAQDEGLRESLKLAQELEKVARQGVDNKTADEPFKKELAGMSKKFDAAAKSSDRDSAAAAETQQSLKDLQAELAAARDMAQLPDLPKGAEEWGRQWAQRLGAMPQLKRQMDKAWQPEEGRGQGDLKAFLDRLERQVSGELDRRALLDAQQYLQQMMQQGQAGKSENYARSSGQGQEDAAADGAKEKNTSNLAGKEPGKKSDEPSPLPEFRADASTHVKGALGDGESSALMFKGKPAPGKSAVTPSEVVASYRRQAEEELNSERVPEALKETIKNYFLSLGEARR